MEFEKNLKGNKFKAKEKKYIAKLKKAKKKFKE